MSVTSSRPTQHPIRVAVPQQHGAWAFLAVPLLIGLFLVGLTLPTGLFAVTWVLVYPASHYLGRALVVRARRGTWSRIAKRELRDALPWIGATAIPAVLLLGLRPWLVLVGLVLAALWLISLGLTRSGHERGITNDLLLVTQAALAVPLLGSVATDSWPTSSAWWAAAICLIFFTGSVLHVKSLLRGADDRRWAIGSRVYHLASLSLAALSPWLLLPFGAAALRAFLVPARSKPGVIGAVEAVVSVLVVIGAVLALA